MKRKKAKPRWKMPKSTKWEIAEDDWHRRRRQDGPTVNRAWSDFLAPLPWQLFVTLTFDLHRVFPVDQQVASREAFQWCNTTSWIYRLPLGWIYAPERSPSGVWHAHALLIGVPWLRPQQEDDEEDLPEARGMWTARNGIINVRRVHSAPGASLYTTKQAAFSGKVVWSDTLSRYLDGRAPK